MDSKKTSVNFKGSKVNFLEDMGIETHGASSAYVITYTPFFRNVVRKELEEIDDSVHIVKKISDGLSIITSQNVQKEFFNKVLELDPENVRAKEGLSKLNM